MIVTEFLDLEVDDDIAFDVVVDLAAGTMTFESLTAVIAGWLDQK